MTCGTELSLFTCALCAMVSSA